MTETEIMILIGVIGGIPPGMGMELLIKRCAKVYSKRSCRIFVASFMIWNILLGIHFRVLIMTVLSITVFLSWATTTLLIRLIAKTSHN